MRDSLQAHVQQLLRAEKKRRRWLMALLLIAPIVFFSTTAGMMRYGETLAYQDQVLDCQYSAPQGEGYAGYAIHTHTDVCYDADGNLVCPLPEIGLEDGQQLHTHNSDCYNEQGELVCGLLELQEHVHDATALSSPPIRLRS